MKKTRNLAHLVLSIVSVFAVAACLFACSSEHAHTWGAWTSDGGETHSRICQDCEEKQTEPHNLVGGVCGDCGYVCEEHEHVFIDYVFNNDSTCVENGTETSKCKYCDVTDTRTKTGTATGEHTFENYVCKVCGEYTPNAPITDGLEFFPVMSDGNTITYSVNGIGTATDKDIIIPKQYNGSPVTAIGANAFSDCEELTSVTIPNSVTTIEDSAFGGCTGLTRVVLPVSATRVCSTAFWACTGLTQTEYDNAYYLGNSENPYEILIAAKSTDITSCAINDKTSIITAEAFSGCVNLSSVTLPDSIEGAGYDAFSGCNSLIYAEYDNAYYLGNDENPYMLLVAAKSYQITTCTIHERTKIICGGAFEDTEINKIEIPDSVTKIDAYAFFEIDTLKKVTIGSGVKYIEYMAFVSTHDGIDEITVSGDNEFYHSKNNCLIETATKRLIVGTDNSVIPDDGSVVTIGSYAFAECKELTSVSVPDSVIIIEKDAFYYYWDSNLTSVTIPASVTYIGKSAFYVKGLTIYCEATEKPSGWHDDWYDDWGGKSNVIWDYKNNVQ